MPSYFSATGQTQWNNICLIGNNSLTHWCQKFAQLYMCSLREKVKLPISFSEFFFCEGKVFLKINPALCSVLLSTKDTHRCLAHCHFCTVAGFSRCIFFYRQTNKHRSGGGKNLRWSFSEERLIIIGLRESNSYPMKTMFNYRCYSLSIFLFYYFSSGHWWEIRSKH